MFDTKTLNAAGIYSVKLYDMGVPISVIVDDYIPYDAYWNDTAFWYINTVTKSLWPHVLQKAASKLLTNYDALEWLDDPLNRGQQLLGAPSSWWMTSAYTATNLYTLLRRYTTAGNIMTAASNVSVSGL